MKTLADVQWDDWQATDPATLVFVVEGHRILLIHKKTGLGAGKINAPGGKVDPGETPEQCAVRECQEELHITPRALQYCGQNLFQFVDGYSIHVWVYKTSLYDGVPRETHEARPLWCPLDAIPFDQMWEDDRLWLPLVLDDQIFVARWIFEGHNMLDSQIDIVQGDHDGGMQDFSVYAGRHLKHG